MLAAPRRCDHEEPLADDELTVFSELVEAKVALAGALGILEYQLDHDG